MTRLIAPPEEQSVEDWADAVASGLSSTQTAHVVTYEQIKDVMLHCLVRRGMVPLSSSDPTKLHFQKL